MVAIFRDSLDGAFRVRDVADIEKMLFALRILG